MRLHWAVAMLPAGCILSGAAPSGLEPISFSVDTPVGSQLWWRLARPLTAREGQRLLDRVAAELRVPRYVSGHAFHWPERGYPAGETMIPVIALCP